MTATNVTSSPRSARAIVALLALSAAVGLLALFQWMELFVLHNGGEAVCGINAVVNCANVWNTPLALWFHRVLRMPIAALGVVWALTAFICSLRLALAGLTGKPAKGAVTSIRVVAVAGLLACAVFAVDHFSSGSVCLTCLGTYAFTLAFAHVAFRYFSEPWMPPSGEAAKALLWPALLAAGLYAIMLWPGSNTPKAKLNSLTRVPPPAAEAAPTTASVANAPATDLDRYLGTLSPMERQGLSDALAGFRASAPVGGTERFPIRLRVGSPEAPMKVVEFTDIRCSHCRTLEETMAELRRLVPRESMSVEPRHFPLDSQCNPILQGSDGTGTRCVGAKAQICLEGAPDFLALREKLFESQASLTPDKVLEIASSGSIKRPALEACIGKRETVDRLAQDIQYASLYKPQGTPLVLINGRKASPAGPFLYALALAGGNPDAPEFKKLPPGSPQP